MDRAILAAGGTALTRELVRTLRYEVMHEGGGDVQKALGSADEPAEAGSVTPGNAARQHEVLSAGMGALKPWHIAVLLCCFGSLAAVIAAVVVLVRRR
jgi:hypothetical protein